MPLQMPCEANRHRAAGTSKSLSPPAPSPQAPHAQLGEPNPAPPSFFAPRISPTSPVPPLLLSAKPTRSHRTARSRLPPPPPPQLPAPTCSGSCPVCSNWDEDSPYTEVIWLEEMSRCKLNCNPHAVPILGFSRTHKRRVVWVGWRHFPNLHQQPHELSRLLTCCYSSMKLDVLLANTAKTPSEMQPKPSLAPARAQPHDPGYTAEGPSSAGRAEGLGDAHTTASSRTAPRCRARFV